MLERDIQNPLRGPKTVEEFLALPVGEMFLRREEILPNGVKRWTPVARKLSAIYHEPDDIFCVTDDTGRQWVVFAADDQLFRREIW